MTDIDIKEKCKHCLGTGLLDGKSCPKCGGDGWRESSKIDTTVIMAEIKNSLKKCPTSLILENTDSDEYIALNADKKAWYNLFISAGTLDMREGSKAHDLFLAWIFPSGVSHTAILAAMADL